MSDSDSDSFGVITRKGRLYRKRNHDKESKQRMINYYADPEKREKLKERIKNYNEAIKAMQEKVAKLNEYLAAYENDKQNAPTF